MSMSSKTHILVTLAAVTLYADKRVRAGNQSAATGQIFQAAAMMTRLPAMLSGHGSAKWFWESMDSEATDQ